MRQVSFDPIEFLERAIATPSIDDVTAMRQLLVDELAAHSVESETDSAGNVIARRGMGSPVVVLNTHLDTVPPAISLERDDDIIRGRGACDAKGPLAAFLAAFLEAEPTGSILLAITPDEETASTGAAALDIDADAYIVGEPTGLDVCHAAKGRFVAVITIHGENAHAAEPHNGVNAVRLAAPVLTAIESFDDEEGPGTDEVLGRPLLTPTVIRGGETTNQIPSSCEIIVDRRSVPPETADGFRAALEQHITRHVPTELGVSVELMDRETPFLEAFVTPTDDPLVTTLQAAVDGAVRPFTAATEAAYFAKRAPTVVFGPGVLVDDAGPVAHADREYVRASAVVAAARAVTWTIESL